MTAANLTNKNYSRYQRKLDIRESEMYSSRDMLFSLYLGQTAHHADNSDNQFCIFHLAPRSQSPNLSTSGFGGESFFGIFLTKYMIPST